MDDAIWDKHRRVDGSINLAEVLREDRGLSPYASMDQAFLYLRLVESIQPVKSRQAAAIAIATALHMQMLTRVVNRV